MGKSEDRPAQTIQLLQEGLTQNFDELTTLNCSFEQEAKRKSSLSIESALKDFLQCETDRTSGIHINKSYSLCKPLINLKNSAAVHKQIDDEIQTNTTQSSPANRLKASSRLYLDCGAKTKPMSNVSHGSVINMQKMVKKLKKSTRASQKVEISADRYQEIDSNTSVVKLKIVHSPKCNLTTPCGNKTSKKVREVSKYKSISNTFKPSLPQLPRNVQDFSKKLFRKDINENAKESSANEGSHVWMPSRFEPSFKFRSDELVTSTVCHDYAGGKSSLTSDTEGISPNCIMPVSSLGKSVLYHSYFPLLVESYSTLMPSRSKRFSRPPFFTKRNLTAHSYRESLNEDAAIQARTDYKHCTTLHNSCTHNSCTSMGQMETKSLSLDQTDMTIDETQQKGGYENDEVLFWRYSATKNSKTCKDVSKMGEKVRGGKLKHNGPQLQNNDIHWIEQCTVKKQASYCNVWKSIIKNRDLKQTTGKVKQENEADIEAAEASDKAAQKWHKRAPSSKEDDKNTELSEMNLFINEVAGADGELTPSQFSSSIDADDRTTKMKKNYRFRSSRCLRKFLQQFPTEKDEIYFTPHCRHSEVFERYSAAENLPLANYSLNQGCDNNDNWNNSEQDTSSQFTASLTTQITAPSTIPAASPNTATPQRTISYHTSSDDLISGAIPDNVKQECSVKGYEVIRLIVRGTSYKFSKIFLTNNRNNISITPVEIVAYTQPYTYFLTSCYCNDSKTSNRHHMLNRALDLPLHRNLVTLLHRFCSPLMVYQVAEHFPWPSLTHLISTTSSGWVSNNKKGLTEETRRSIFKQICNGMEHLHLYGIVHGGLNCDNILVSEKLEVKLANYGPACQRLSMSYDPVRDRMFPRIIPYDAYTPPEMMTVSGSWTRSCDVWCIGVVLLEMTLGEIPPSLNAAIRLSGSAKKVERVGLETCGYQLSLLIDKILQCRPSQRPHVSTLSQHAWLSDGTEMVVVLNKGSLKVSKRIDGSTFPLPKRVQNQMLPSSEAFYDNSDVETETNNMCSCRTEGFYGRRPEEIGDSRVAVTSSWNESSHADTSDDRHYQHSISCNHCQPRSEKKRDGEESESAEHQQYSNSLTLEEKFFSRFMSESSENKGFLSNLVESLDTMSSSDIAGYSNNRDGVSKHRRRSNANRHKGLNNHKNRTKKAKLSRRGTPPSAYLDYLSRCKTSLRYDKDGDGASWTGLYNKYLDSEFSASASPHSAYEDSSTLFNFTDCNNEFVMEDDDKALEEIESMIREEEKEFWGREYGQFTAESK